MQAKTGRAKGVLLNRLYGHHFSPQNSLQRGIRSVDEDDKVKFEDDEKEMEDEERREDSELQAISMEQHLVRARQKFGELASFEIRPPKLPFGHESKSSLAPCLWRVYPRQSLRMCLLS